MDIQFKETISTEEQLREVLGYPTELVTRKTIDHIDSICQSFIEESPFITIATSNAVGQMDVSPKGDPPGFVKILNNKMLAIPDRPGNRKADTFTNIIQNPNIGLIFLIPGIKETLRINGTAQIIRDESILKKLECEGKPPTFAIIVHVKEAFMHCAKCMIRSKLWSTDSEPQERTIPTLAQTLVDHSQMEMDIQELDEAIKNDEETNLY
ncbi:pyridoxamine 5'-phosphate oxidase family protein [Jiulongibacter sediminis]|uniref:Pyridoxamine 5'-phosphate oxidase N-terminal domain-containing protein n=1 Tax=Jiulongibacter sediminis TaxID=1605367 RepID=A0A0P7BQ24_9BACT|nr:pyridoxamine 5'-phosphate oxidase family protein [Jiulongibacter sediminis]KPM47302.1 hypothetical protein AFM12_16045 [Jiulongibacter sediminis]TBX22860.1 hypothetical protein TK44_16055 [Jiulongibacter sediminis]